MVELCIFTPKPEAGSNVSRPFPVAVKRLKPNVMKSMIDIKSMLKEGALLKKLCNK